VAVAGPPSTVAGAASGAPEENGSNPVSLSDRSQYSGNEDSGAAIFFLLAFRFTYVTIHHPMTKRKVLLLAGDFVEGLECYFAAQALSMLGFEVHSACPGKAAGSTIATAVHDFDGFQTYSEKRGHNFPIDRTWGSPDVIPENYDGLYIPGGRAPEYLRLDESVLAFVRQMNEARKPIASLCHGPQLLITANICHGKRMTCYKAVRPDLIMAGAEFVDVPNTDAVVDGNIVTGVDWVGQGQVVKEFATLLGAVITPAEQADHAEPPHKRKKN
jgi:protease I